MTMRNLLDGEIQMIKPTFVKGKRYMFTWPGSGPRVVSAEEMADICKGANHEMLQIVEYNEEPELKSNR